MQFANALVALGGDRRNTVPLYGVSAAEIAVLCAIHGADAVHDVEPLAGETEVSTSAEKERLLAKYPARDNDNVLIVEAVYPGRRPEMHETFEDLGLHESQFRTERVVQAPPSFKKKSAKPKAKPAPVAATASDNADALFPDDDAEAGEEAADLLA